MVWGELEQVKKHPRAPRVCTPAQGQSCARARPCSGDPRAGKPTQRRATAKSSGAAFATGAERPKRKWQAMEVGLF